MDNQVTFQPGVFGAYTSVLILVLMDNQVTLATSEPYFDGYIVLILVLMDNQVTRFGASRAGYS